MYVRIVFYVECVVVMVTELAEAGGRPGKRF